tara:strand:+ start:1773 stop:2003 length:231 start_codon:yes stop_codon:yes gene_type:complete
MKENKLIEMKNKVEALTRVSQHMINELAQIKDLAIGTLETIKNMPDYDEAIKKLKADVIEKSSKTEKTKPLEATSD